MRTFKTKTPSMLMVPCEQCGTELMRFPSQAKNHKYGLFCNLECLGKFRTAKLTGEWAANYKTGSRESNGYIEVEASWHPFANKRGYVGLHRLVAEARLGRFLSSNEIVHHTDGNKRNNHWDNLSAMTQAAHAKLHIDAGEVVRNNKTGRLEKGKR